MTGEPIFWTKYPRRKCCLNPFFLSFFCLFSIKWCQHLQSPFFLQPPTVHCTKVRGAQILSPTRRMTLCKGRAINNYILSWKRQCAWRLSKHIISVVDFISLSPSHLRMSIRLGPQEDYNICIFSYGYLLGWFLWQKLGSPTTPICNNGGSGNSEVASPWS